METEQIVSTLITLIGGLGIGSLLTTYLKDRFDKRQFRYREKLTVYAGYVEALQNSVVSSSQENRQKVVYWHQRLKLVAPQKIVTISAKFFDNEATEKFSVTRDEIVREMRVDLDKSL
ncbi:hypothetical protein OVA03_06515 [Asticcacaulis sp. SL142]|uniref:hypothetical protein n=1 Tax=Asticcacaulis sp. SL142 TaxID=2995155 RepID=UPI00226CE02D|nr:hypothetical protein [Asticcacaulis sp. SL142]WAC49552.1 hypothetical protein OVA03_06515 [Asticcacaulis sp. SL142]